MYAVIFKAELIPERLDEDYEHTAARLRQLAQERYGCLDFTVQTEAGVETAVSFWPSLEHIQLWKADPEHRVAQQRGRDYWYHHYSIEVVEVQEQFST